MSGHILPHPSSYKDRDGFIFTYQNKYYRCINLSYFNNYYLLIKSGLYDQLVKKKWLLPHTEINNNTELNFSDTIIILPQQINYISYAYEWSFAMLQDAALLTLHIAKAAIEKGMMLKDATPFNIQFINGKPIFIDTTSFEEYNEKKPWIAYRQFCECFLAPLLLQKYCNAELGKLFIVYPNGIPLQILKSLLPTKAKWSLHNYLHVYLQSTVSNKKENKTHVQSFSKQKMLLLLNELISYATKLNPKKNKTVWDDYYNSSILNAAYLQEKTILVAEFIKSVSFNTVIDLGANDGYFSLLLKNTDTQIVAVDADVNCINNLYKKIKEEKITNILPIVNTLNNPSPAIGWNNEERMLLHQRFNSDMVFALALVHHLAIGYNVPLQLISKWLQQFGSYLLIEFVPKMDEKVQLLLQNREDIFDDYNTSNFENIFTKSYNIILQKKIARTERVLYLMKKL